MKSVTWTLLTVAAICLGTSRLVLAEDAPPPAPADETRVIADFEKESDIRLVRRNDDHVSIAIDESHATSGTHALKVTSKEGPDHGGFDLAGAALQGWDKYKYLVFDLTSDSDVKMPFHLEAQDDKTTNYGTRASIKEGLPVLGKGKVTIVVETAKLRRNDGSGLIDLSTLKRFRCILETKAITEPYVTYLDNIRLTNTAPAK